MDFRLVIITIICMLVFLVGAFGNLISIYVFKNKIFNKQATTTYLIAASISNVISVIYLPLLIIPSIYTLNIVSYKVFFGSMMIVEQAQSWIITVVSIDRLVTVVCPGKFLYKK